MNDVELEAELAAANPIDEQVVASTIPPAVGEAMLREIVDEGRPSVLQRLAYSFGGFGGRAAFVGVLAMVVIAVSALNVVSFGASTNEDVAGSGQLGDSTPNLGPDTNDGDATVIAPTTIVVRAESTGSPSSDIGETPSAPPITVTAAPTTSAPTTAAPATTAAASEANQDPAPALTTGSDCFTIEAESMKLVGAWKQNSDGGASGGSYITWEGLSAERNNSSPIDVIEATISVSNPGTYRFVWAMRQPADVAGDKANDSWLNFPDASRFGPISGGSYDGFVKVFGNSKDDFGWTAKADQHEAKSDIAIEFSKAGSYKMEIAGRSHGHQIDKIVIYRDGIGRDDAINNRCAGHIPTAAPGSVQDSSETS